jgi:tripeptidyl-peptidase I
LNETNKRSDVAKFLRQFRPAAASAAHKFPIIEIANAPNDQGPYTPEQIDDQVNIEGNLDAELVLGISWPTPMTAYCTSSHPFMQCKRVC